MSLDPRTLAMRGVPIFIDGPRPCMSCGYNLQGLRADGVCPECGRPIRSRKDVPRYTDNLVNAPLGYLRVFSFGCLVLMLGGVGLIAALIVQYAGLSGPVLGLAAGVVWYSGVMIVTQPRPVTAAATVDPRVEWFAPRLAARLTQACWVLGAGAAYAWTNTGVGGGGGAPGAGALIASALPWTAAVAFTAAIAGIVPLCVCLSNLAFWAADSSLGYSFRACAWLAGVYAPLSLIAAADALTGGGLFRSFGLLGFGSLLVLAFFRGSLVLCSLYCLWRVHSMSRWAIRNHLGAEERVERIRERAEAAAADTAVLASRDGVATAEFPRLAPSSEVPVPVVPPTPPQRARKQGGPTGAAKPRAVEPYGLAPDER